MEWTETVSWAMMALGVTMIAYLFDRGGSDDR